MSKQDAKQITIPSAVTDIAKRARIKGMNLVRCECEFIEALPPGQIISDVKLELRGGSDVFRAEPRTIVCSFGMEVVPMGPNGKPPKVARISCDYAAVYEFDDDAFFNAIVPEHRDLFAAYNTSFQMWPHAREFVQSMAARMSIPPVVLPAFRPLEMIGTPEFWKKRTKETTERA
jgi:hypothetical protein